MRFKILIFLVSSLTFGADEKLDDQLLEQSSTDVEDITQKVRGSPENDDELEEEEDEDEDAEKKEEPKKKEAENKKEPEKKEAEKKEAPKSTKTPGETETDKIEDDALEELDDWSKWTRYGWWALVLYMFYAQATVCDEYFVESIKVVVEKYGIPEDVAGATLMALGCNGPELATNFIALFITHSPLGVGTIIGSEIFNLLCIIAGCAIVSPVPMVINKVPFFRDSFFYALSIVLLAWVLADGMVSNLEAWVLLGFGVVFATTVAMTQRILGCLGVKSNEDVVVMTVPVEEEFHVPNTDQVVVKQIGTMERSMLQDRRTSHFFPRSALKDLMAEGEVEVSIQRHNRLQDSRSHTAVHSLTMEESGIYIDMGSEENPFISVPTYAAATVALGIRPKHFKEEQQKHDMQFKIVSGGSSPAASRHSLSHLSTPQGTPRENKDKQPTRRTLGAMKVSQSGGRIRLSQSAAAPASGEAKRPSGFEKVSGGWSEQKLTEPLLAAQQNDMDQASSVGTSAWEPEKAAPSIKYEDIVRVLNHGPLDLQVDIRGDWQEIVSLQIHCKKESQKENFFQQLEHHRVNIVKKDNTLAAIQMATKDISSKDIDLLHKFINFIFWPLHVCLAITLRWCDPTNPVKHGRWPAAFCISMVWLSIFSFIMVSASDQISTTFGISQTILGVTVCAVGTSFPNFFASILMAKDGRSAMAVSNALGSNVQNVFLALSVPWILRTAIPDIHNLPMDAKGIFTGVIWMGATLAMLLVFVITGNLVLSKVAGYIMLLTYICYTLLAVTGH